MAVAPTSLLGQFVQGQEPFTGARMGCRQRLLPQILRGLIPLGEIQFQHTLNAWLFRVAAPPDEAPCAALDLSTKTTRPTLDAV